MNTLKTTVATIGLIAGLCTAAQPIPRAHAESARRAVCEQWLSVVNNERYDAAMRQYAAQTIRDCGFAVSYGGPVWTPGYAPTPPLAPVVAAPSAQGGGLELALANTRSGHFVDATVNGANVRFLLDTGASISSITMDEALALTRLGGLSKDDLRRPVSIELADGTVVNQLTIAVERLVRRAHHSPAHRDWRLESAWY